MKPPSPLFFAHQLRTGPVPRWRYVQPMTAIGSDMHLHPVTAPLWKWIAREALRFVLFVGTGPPLRSTLPSFCRQPATHWPVPREYPPLGHWRCCSVTEPVVALLFLLHLRFAFLVAARPSALTPVCPETPVAWLAWGRLKERTRTRTK
jgi:hypothetical protein